MRPSLQGRLRLGLIISLVVLFVLQWLVVTRTVQHLTNEYIVSRLVHDAETILASVNVVDNKLTYTQGKIDSIYSQPFSGHYFLITNPVFQYRSRSLWDSDFPLYPKGEDIAYAPGPMAQVLLIKTERYHKQGHEITIAVAEDVSATEASLDTFLLIYASVSLFALVFLIVLQSLVVKRSFASLERVREDILRLERGEITQISEDVPIEVYPLVKEFNRLLTVVAQRLERSRNALGNLAHALKTPLTVLMRMGSQQELEHLPQVRDQLKQHTTTIQRLMDRQLKSARLAGASTPGAQFICREEVPRLVDTLQRIYQDKEVKIECHIAKDGAYSGDREDMIELFGNLLDNACKWAAGHVTLNVAAGKGLTFTIEDDGPGSPDEQLAKVSERGLRLDESVAGHGLGLSIVKEIVQSYQGQVRFERSQALGGFRVEVNLPE